MKSSIGALSFLALLLTSTTSNAQCKGFAKNQCIPQLDPFIHNGQLNSTVLMAGEKAEAQVTFFGGQEYRVLACGQPILGKVHFRLLDKNRKPVFDSREHNNPEFWDFSIGATQQFIIEVEVDGTSSSHGLVENGCVAIVIGFKATQ